jgi:glutamine synthetase
MLAIEKAGLVVEQGHSESSLDQFEISIGPLPAMAAVHAVFCATEIIKETSRQNGFRAIFHPKPFQKLQPTGLHLHLSVHSQDPHGKEVEVDQLVQTSTRSSHEIPRTTADTFLAGILKRLSLITAISLPSQDSYLRASTGVAMGNVVSWGKENSSVPVSEVSTGYWEIRSLDWTANIYLALAAYLSAGLLGIKGNEKLQWKDPRAITYKLEAAAAKNLGISESLPTKMDEALQCLIREKYGDLQEFMGEEILDLFVTVKTAELEYVKTLSDEERRNLLLFHI